MGPTPWNYAMLRDRTTVLTFRVFGKYNNPPAFSGFWPFPKGAIWAKIPTEIWKLIFWWLLFKNDIKKCLHTKVLRRGLDGSWPLGFWYLTRKTTVLTFRVFGKYNNPPSFSGCWQFPKGVLGSQIPTGIWKKKLSWGVPRYGSNFFLYYLGVPERIRWVPPPQTLLFGEIGPRF